MALDTRTALLDVAENVARRRGFDGFSYADLADAVGIRKASIHYHFPTKADLSIALVERYKETFFAQLAEISAHETSAVGRFDELISLYRRALSEGETVCLCVSFSPHAEVMTPEVRAELTAFREGVTAWIAEVLALGRADGSLRFAGTPEAAAPGILALLEGAQLAARAQGDLAPFEASATGLRAMFCA